MVFFSLTPHRYVIAIYCSITVYNMADGFVLLRLSITLYSQSEPGSFILNSLSCQIALEMAFLWRTLVTFKMVSRLALSAATRSLPSAKKQERTWKVMLFLCDGTSSILIQTSGLENTTGKQGTQSTDIQVHLICIENVCKIWHYHRLNRHNESLLMN